MVIGLSPEYNYPGNYKKWLTNNTYYAGNHGASLICRSIMKQFKADYIDNFSDLNSLNNEYDVCFMALATHVHRWRDISFFSDIAEKLDMKIIVLSLGIQDYEQVPSSMINLHPSILKLLNIASERSKLIGVRGHYTASILYRLGYKNVVPIGCPSLYWNMSEELEINKPTDFTNPLVVYHRTIAPYGDDILKHIAILGQDYEDELMFTNNLENDYVLKDIIHTYYNKLKNKNLILDNIKNNGIFPRNFESWFNVISKHDFVLGPRLHGCIAALIQGIPAVLIPRDIRVKEMSEFYSIPTVKFEELNRISISDIYSRLDYSDFNRKYKCRYNNYIEFLNENEIEHILPSDEAVNGFSFSYEDMESNYKIWNSYIEDSIENNAGYIIYNRIKGIYRNISSILINIKKHFKKIIKLR